MIRKNLVYALPAIVIIGYLLVVFMVIRNGFDVLFGDYGIEDAKKVYNKYSKELTNIVAFLDDNDENLIIFATSYFNEELNSGDYAPKDNNFIAFFRKCNGRNIKKEKNVVYFQLWDNLDIGKGICYIENLAKFDNEYVTTLESLGYPCWYYYVEE